MKNNINYKHRHTHARTKICLFFLVGGILEYKINSKNFGGGSRTAEIDENNFGKIKYNREHNVQGQWCSIVQYNIGIYILLVQGLAGETGWKETTGET